MFKNVSGDAIRVRDYGYGNVIVENRISKAGATAYSEWFCDAANLSACTKADECWSWENQFRDNLLDGSYDCTPLRVWTYLQRNRPANCTRPDRGADRLHTSGNTQTSAPCSL